MLRRFCWLALAAAVAMVALVVPTAALAGGGCTDGSSTSIYSEGCVPKEKAPSHPKKHKTPPATKPTTPPPPVYTVTTPPVTPVVVVHPKTHRSTHVRKHKKVVHHVKHHHVVAKPVLASSPTKESSLGSAFDLGTGPIVLFALLAGTVLLLLGTGGVRSWRNRHRV